MNPIAETISGMLAREVAIQQDKAELKFLSNRFFDELQAHIVIAGGNRIPRSDLRKMTLGEITDLLLHNDIKLVVVNTQSQV